jgi:5'-deoxynucleotidase
MSHFFAYLSRMKFIQRWGLMYNTHDENIQEHSLQVALIAHALATIRNREFGGELNADRAASLALYHDASEVLTGDLPAPVKYFNPEIRDAYHSIELGASKQLLAMLPDRLRDAYRSYLVPGPADATLKELVKAADKLCAYVKCLEEMRAGNDEFAAAERALKQTIDAIDLEEVRYFMRHFVPSFKLTLDELG